MAIQDWSEWGSTGAARDGRVVRIVYARETDKPEYRQRGGIAFIYALAYWREPIMAGSKVRYPGGFYPVGGGPAHMNTPYEGVFGFQEIDQVPAQAAA